MKINFLSSIINKSNTDDNPLYVAFDKNKFSKKTESIGNYPLIESPSDHRIYAHFIKFLVQLNDVVVVEEIFEKNGYSITSSGSELIHSANKDLSVFVRKKEEFNGMSFSLITNDNFLISDLQTSHIRPPFPQETFPHIDPEVYGALQGNMEFWWSFYWKPYWKSLTDDQINSLLIPDEWMNFIERHS
ncbi:hypothetical protein [Thiothrix lacustris]|uniref:hypothetical protein n=1 Tax=Thiothrix lacustris TaxID=525917 RepID=UPI0027E42E8D|nr:hypothetical protein [Thiothrix lacustris]WMP18875.1 hypothetical protein RCS87_07365 [Thiothrix lacustris]